MIAPIRFDVCRFLALNEFWASLDFRRVPERYREPLRGYFRHGILPDRPLRLLLEGSIDAIGLFRDDLPGLLEVADWMREVPGSCWGSPDQVQLWITYARQQAAECDARWKRTNDRSSDP